MTHLLAVLLIVLSVVSLAHAFQQLRSLQQTEEYRTVVATPQDGGAVLRTPEGGTAVVSAPGEYRTVVTTPQDGGAVMRTPEGGTAVVSAPGEYRTVVATPGGRGTGQMGLIAVNPNPDGSLVIRTPTVVYYPPSMEVVPPSNVVVPPSNVNVIRVPDVTDVTTSNPRPPNMNPVLSPIHNGNPQPGTPGNSNVCRETPVQGFTDSIWTKSNTQDPDVQMAADFALQTKWPTSYHMSVTSACSQQELGPFIRNVMAGSTTYDLVINIDTPTECQTVRAHVNKFDNVMTLLAINLHILTQGWVHTCTPISTREPTILANCDATPTPGYINTWMTVSNTDLLIEQAALLVLETNELDFPFTLFSACVQTEESTIPPLLKSGSTSYQLTINVDLPDNSCRQVKAVVNNNNGVMYVLSFNLKYDEC